MRRAFLFLPILLVGCAKPAPPPRTVSPEEAYLVEIKQALMKEKKINDVTGNLMQDAAVDYRAKGSVAAPTIKLIREQISAKRDWQTAAARIVAPPKYTKFNEGIVRHQKELTDSFEILVNALEKGDKKAVTKTLEDQGKLMTRNLAENNAATGGKTVTSFVMDDLATYQGTSKKPH